MKLDEKTQKLINVTATEYADYHIVKDMYAGVNSDWIVTPTQDFSKLNEKARYNSYDCAIHTSANEPSRKIEIKSRSEKYHITTFKDLEVNQAKIDKLKALDGSPILVGIYPADGKMAIWDINNTHYQPSTQYSAETTIGQGDDTTKVEKAMYSFPLNEAQIVDFNASEWYKCYWKCYYWHYYNQMNK